MRRVLLTMAILFFTALAWAQNGHTIKGKVIDEDNQALVGATVMVKGTSTGTITGVDGTYSLQVESLPATLVVSYIGYGSVEREVSGSGDADFVLKPDALKLGEIVVTGVANPKSKLESSVSITTLNPSDVLQTSPRTTAEIFRTIPGVRSEASGGEGNTNITVRGVPISAGGAKYLQLQEDGLPIFLFGDIAFATADIFLRADLSLQRIEAIRGGSASTLASNSPAGIINFISKTGAVEGGSISSTVGIDYNSYRTDFEYGSPLGNGVSFHVGGFMRTGEGVRTAGYLANKGGQIKANLTKSFERGYARVYYKYLNDRTVAYMPMPIQVSGTNADPQWESIDGFDATHGTPHSPFLASNFGLGADGQRRNVDVADGMHPVSQSVGIDFSFDLGEGWTVRNKGRMAFNSGRFLAPFPAAVGPTADMLDVIGGAINRDMTGATLTYAHSGEVFNGDLAQVIHLFDTELKNFNNIVNDFKIDKTFGNVTISAGYFKAQQNINMAWLWNSYLMEVNGGDAGVLNIMLSDSTQISESGLYAYGVPVWGNCCQVEYDATYDLSAPYANVSIDLDALSIDASIRYDAGKVRGVGFGGAQGQVDVNNDGVIAPYEESVSVVNLAKKNPVNYDYSYLSYSVGANYKLSSEAAVFARYSSGASAKADRAIFPAGSYLQDAKGNTSFGPKDVIDQAELGYKQRFSNGGLFITGFYAKTTEEGGFEATTQKVIENDYTAMGVELEGAFVFGGLGLRGALTYTKATISSGDNQGNVPRRQPAFMYSLIPTYSFGNHAIGLSVIGQTQAYSQDVNKLVMPGYTILNGFIDFGITKSLDLSLNANNLLNVIGITEAEEGEITEGQVNYLRARSITGRSISMTVRYKF